MTTETDDPGWIDIGDDHAIKFVGYKDDQKVGVNVRHKKPDGSACAGWAPFAGYAWAKEFDGVPDYQAWQVQSLYPLTISPSILCRSCGDHGFIRDGKWVRA